MPKKKEDDSHLKTKCQRSRIVLCSVKISSSAVSQLKYVDCGHGQNTKSKSPKKHFALRWGEVRGFFSYLRCGRGVFTDFECGLRCAMQSN